LRSKEIKKIFSSDLMVGDIIQVNSGMITACDIVLFDGSI